MIFSKDLCYSCSSGDCGVALGSVVELPSVRLWREDFLPSVAPVVVSDGLSPVSLGDPVSVWPRGEDGVTLALVLPLVAPGEVGVAVAPGEAALSVPAPSEAVASGEAAPVGE